MRKDPVVEFTTRPPPGDLKNVVDLLRAVLGKVTAIADVLLLFKEDGYTVTNAASGAGTALAFTRVLLDFADAGVDQCRLVVRGNAGAAGTVQVAAYDVTGSKELCRVAVTDGTDVTVAGAWTSLTPTGLDHEVELRAIGDGALDPLLFRVSLQLRTLKAP